MEEESGKLNAVSITVKNHGMEAFAFVSRSVGATLTRYDLEKELEALHIKIGISEEAIKALLAGKESCQEVKIACGQKTTPGQDGYFEYFFDRSVDTKPRILEDGTVDYRAMTRIVTVSEGDKIIEYHPAVKGTDGFDIFGKIIKASGGKQLSPILGKGFTISEDKRIYTASLTGKIEFQNDRLIISNLLEIKEDIDFLHGDISFKGDLMIYGNVMQGIMIKADGMITIRGHVEASTIIAGKDIVFESGMQGAGKGIVVSKGNISGKFFEQVQMKAEGDITANAIMNCSMEAGGSIIVTGRRGIILGGMLSAVKGISAGTVGNISEIRTTLSVGILENVLIQVRSIDEKLEQIKRRMVQIDAAIIMISEREEAGGNHKFSAQKIQLMRSKISINSEMMKLTQEKENLLSRFQQSRDAKIRIDKIVYPKTTISVNGANKTITEEIVRVAFTEKDNEIETHIL